MWRGAPRAVNFQVTHHHVVAAPNAELNERVGDKHPDGVKHVRIMLAVRHHQEIFG